MSNLSNYDSPRNDLSLSNLLTYPDKIMFTSFYNYIKDRVILTDKNIKKIERNETDDIAIFNQFIEMYHSKHNSHTLMNESGQSIKFKLGERLGSGSWGVIYPIEGSNICIKFILLETRKQRVDANQNNVNMNEYLNLSHREETILPLKQLHMTNDLSTYTNKSKTKSRIRVYLMLKCNYDLKKVSVTPFKNPVYIVWSPTFLKHILNSLMEQFSKLQGFYKTSVTDYEIPIGDSYPKINPIQLFDLKPTNCALSISTTGTYLINAYLIDLDGYYILRKNTDRNGNWISSFPPIEFYKERELINAQFIEPSDFRQLINSHPNYYKHGLHSSWMFGILIYQMINHYNNLPKSKVTERVNFFNFINHKRNRLRDCTNRHNLFTSLDNFVARLKEPFKSEWTTSYENDSGRNESFLDKIKSCLYFDDGIYDGSPFMRWSPSMKDRRPFYKEDGTLNYF